MTKASDTYQYDAFISYSHKDSTWVRFTLLPYLERKSLRVCIDFRDFEPGLPGLVNMENAVERSRKTLIVLTADWVESEWATFESLLVQTDDPAGRRARMIPLFLKPCKLPKRIAMLTYLDFTQPAEADFQLQRLVAAIGGRQMPSVSAPALESARKGRPFEVLQARETKAEEGKPVQALAQVTLLLEGIGSFGTFEQQYLIGVLAAVLRLEREQIRVLRVESGSVRVTLEVPADAATKLAQMLKSGQLDLTLVFRPMAASKYHITVTDSRGIVIGDHAQIIQHLDILPSGEGDGETIVLTERAHLEQLLNIHWRNLYKLREQAAIYGSGEVPLRLLNQIESEEWEIRRLQAQLALQNQGG